MNSNRANLPRVQLLNEPSTPNRHPSGDARDRQSRSSSVEPGNDLLLFVPQRQSNVSRREDETDNWCKDIESKEDFRLKLTNRNLGNMILSRLATLRTNRELCDVVLFVKEKEIRAHKVVLASLSPALLDLFNTDLSEMNGVDSNRTTSQLKAPTTTNSHGISNTSYYEFNQGDFECFEALVEYAYTGKLNISSHKISDMYKTAYALQVTAVATACAHYLADNVSCNNCIGIRRVANFNNDTYLVSKVDSFIVENFEKIIDESLEFTKLPCVKAKIIVPRTEHLRSDDLAESLTTRALNYFQNYTKISDRVEQQIDALVQKSHLLYVEEDTTLADCSRMDDHSSVGSCVAVQDYKRSKQSKVEKTVGHNNQPIGAHSIQHHVTGALPVKINASRVANAQYASNESLNSMASTATDVEDEIESKLIAIQQTSPGFWIALAVLYKRLAVFSIQLTDEEIAASGESAGTTPPLLQEPIANGNHSSNALNAKQPIDLSSASVLAKLANCTSVVRQPLPSMNVARCSVGACFLNGRIIVCGGTTRGQVLNSAEEYDIESGQWRILPSMRTERGRFDAATLGGRFYAIAGSSGNSDLKSAECYDPKSRTWTLISDLSKARSQNGCTALEGFVYCTGGSADQQALRDCERFYPELNSWEIVAPLQVGRFGHGCTTWRGLVVVAAGCDRWGQILDNVEAFDPKVGTWKTLPKLSTPRRGCALTVVRDSLYVIGGHDGSQSLQTVEILEHATGHWRQGPSLTTPRANTHAVTSASNSIYVIGGFEGASFLSSIEILENEAQGWRCWIQKRFSQDAAIAEDDEEAETIRASSEPIQLSPTTDRSNDETPRPMASNI